MAEKLIGIISETGGVQDWGKESHVFVGYT